MKNRYALARRNLTNNLRKGFTLIELIVVMVILPILCLIGYVVFHFVSKFW